MGPETSSLLSHIGLQVLSYFIAKGILVQNGVSWERYRALKPPG
jgi:hypothetical protein